MSLSYPATRRLLCLLGHPVGHSLSPEMHNTAIEALGLDYHYMAYDITESQIADALSSMRLLNARGFNLTMPLKTAVVPLLDRLCDSARLTGAVNTVVNDDVVLTGCTTDGTGCMDALRNRGITVCGSRITLLGAGGAARAILAQAALDGVSLVYLARRRNANWEETRRFAGHIEAECGMPVVLTDLADPQAVRRALSDSSVLINATNVGMAQSSQPDASVLPAAFLDPHLFVSDVIYHPKQTRLLADAAAAGCATQNGEDMLLYQAAASFRLWTGEEMPVALVRERCFSQPAAPAV